MNVHQVGEFRYVAVFERSLRRQRNFLGEMQILRHAGIGLPALVILLLQNLGSGAGVAGEEQQEIVLAFYVLFACLDSADSGRS